MLNVSDELKQIYRRNMLPLSTVKADIQGEIVFGDLGVTIRNDRIVKDTFRLTEMISDSGDLDFGSTNASMVEFTVADVPEDLNGQTFTITQTVNGTYTVPLGTFKVDSCKRQDDLRFKDIVAYDNMQKFNINVADWYNGLSFPITVQDMIISLCDYCGIAYEPVALANGSVQVQKTLETNELNGKEVLRAIAEINGTFAHMNRYDKLTFIGLDSFALYPSETLYPSEDLYPEDSTEIFEKEGENAIAYISSKYEDYTVPAIDGVIVRDDENADGGVTVGEATNPYVMSGNMLIIGKETAELTDIATNLLGKIGQVVYTPHETECIGLPYVEVGDTVLNANSADKELFITKRVLTGVSSVMDNFSANGNPKRENNDTVDSVEIRKLKGKTMKITKDIDRIGVEIENFETITNTKFEVADGRITAEINRATEAEGALSSRITQTADSITSEVTRATEAEGALSSRISQSYNGVSMSVSNGEKTAGITIELTKEDGSSEEVTGKIEMTGLVTFNSLKSTGTTQIDGSRLTSGYVSADRIQAKTISSEKLNVTKISAISSDLGDITAGSINIGNSKFKVTSAGVMSCTGADISGKIKSTEGSIGGFEIGSTSIYNGKNSIGNTQNGVYVGTDGIALGANNVFKVTPSGELTSKSGTIGGFTIGASSIYNKKESLSSTFNGVYIGLDGIGLGSKFKVTDDGKLSASDVDLSGEITATGGSIGGFDISSTYFSNGKTTLDSYATGVYIGRDGISVSNANVANVKMSSGEFSIFKGGSNGVAYKYDGITASGRAYNTPFKINSIAVQICASGQYLGFYGVTPVQRQSVQQATVQTVQSVYNKINELLTALKKVGIIS